MAGKTKGQDHDVLAALNSLSRGSVPWRASAGVGLGWLGKGLPRFVAQDTT